MATFVIRGDTGGQQFFNGTPDPDTLIVKKHASIITSVDAALLTTSGAWTVRVDGLLLSTGTDSNNSFGIALFGGNAATSKITVGKTGQVSGGYEGIDAQSPVSVTNHGTISAVEYPLYLSNGADFVVNTGKMIGTTSDATRFFFNNGDDTLINSGRMVGGISTSIGADTVINFQKHGHTIKSGTIVGVIDLGPDNDTFKGGNKAETVQDSGGADHYSLGGGNDLYLAVASSGTDLQDTVNGGKGIDTYSMGNFTRTVSINLGEANPFSANAHYALQSDGSVDTVTNFENVIGGTGTDNIVGSKGANALDGGGGNDKLTGLGGRDILTGGDGADNFFFVKLSDSGTTHKTQDVITDFTQGADHISFEFLEANLNRGFTFIEQQKFHHDHTAQFRYAFDHGNTVVSLDSNGNGKADLTILLKGIHVLTESDFFI